MTRNALDEVFGASGDFTLSSGTVRMGLPHSEGGKRLYVVRPSAAGCTVTLPVAVFLPTPSSYVVVNLGSQPITVIYSIIGVPIVVIPAGQQAEMFLMNDAVPWGVWQSRTSTVAAGTLLAERIPIDLEIGAGAFGPVDLRRLAIDQGATSESSPYAIRCTIRSGALVGSDSTSREALRSGQWPAGSTLLLNIETGAIIAGMGGAGGRGGDVPPGLLSQAGGAGGAAIGIEVNTMIVNRGKINGGGGGGGGAARSGAQAGGGGGAGAGAFRSLGAAGGSPNGPAGGDGTPTIPGAGGGVSLGVGGGDGGFAGIAGASGAAGAAGGAAGYSIIRVSTFAFSYITSGGSLNGSILVV